MQSDEGGMYRNDLLPINNDIVAVKSNDYKNKNKLVSYQKISYFCARRQTTQNYHNNLEHINNIINMDRIKLTREEALRRWKASKELKRKMSEKLEQLVRDSCKEQTDNNSISVEIW